MKTKETCYLSGGLVVDEFSVSLLGHEIVGRLHFSKVCMVWFVLISEVLNYNGIFPSISHLYNIRVQAKQTNER